jgi:hypothetical protein
MFCGIGKLRKWSLTVEGEDGWIAPILEPVEEMEYVSQAQR